MSKTEFTQSGEFVLIIAIAMFLIGFLAGNSKPEGLSEHDDHYLQKPSYQGLGLRVDVSGKQNNPTYIYHNWGYDTANFERVAIWIEDNTYVIQSQAAGTGITKPVKILDP